MTINAPSWPCWWWQNGFSTSPKAGIITWPTFVMPQISYWSFSSRYFQRMTFCSKPAFSMPTGAWLSQWRLSETKWFSIRLTTWAPWRFISSHKWRCGISDGTRCRTRLSFPKSKGDSSQSTLNLIWLSSSMCRSDSISCGLWSTSWSTLSLRKRGYRRETMTTCTITTCVSVGHTSWLTN